MLIPAITAAASDAFARAQAQSFLVTLGAGSLALALSLLLRDLKLPERITLTE